MTPERSSKMDKVLNARQQDITVVLENIEDPRNIAAIMRSCDAVGIQDIYLIHNREKRPRKYGFLSARSAEKWVSLHHFDSVQTCVQQLRQQYDIILTTKLGTGAVNLYELDLTQRVALVFGNERHGISEELSALADGNFMVPQAGMIQSLNISVAVAVSIYEAFRQKTLAGHYLRPGLPEERRNRLWTAWTLPKLTQHEKDTPAGNSLAAGDQPGTGPVGSQGEDG